ncbi:MAG: DNA ligase D, partial [Pirellulaceae bacterium]
YYEGDVLRYCGRVGTGFTRESLRQVRRELEQHRREGSPFRSGLTSAARRGAIWVQPELVCEVEYTEWTNDGYLRHPAFNGLREDKPPDQITREQAKAIPAEPPHPSSPHHAPRTPSANATTVAGVRITHPERIVFPEMGLTKLAIAEYYEAVGPWMLPYVADRPLTLMRCPRGRAQACFYQKHLADGAPDGTRSVPIAEKHGERQYIVVDDLQGLIALVQMGALELHPWPARTDKIESPDMLIFDLDPGEGVPWRGVVAGAFAVREQLADLGLESFPRTTGGKGLHVVAPLARRNSWEELKSFARAIAQELARQRPTEWIANMSKAKRHGKVFIDYLRNQRGATAVANYSTRARPGATVALPVTWDELPTLSGADDWDVANVPARLQERKHDPWDGFHQQRQSITRAMLRAVGMK